jgi:serine/threonine protein kinase
MSDSNLRSVAAWVLQQKAGSGSFAIVWKAMHKETGKVVAIKEISTDRLNKKLKQSLESEVSILKQIRHKNIVHLEDVVEVSRTATPNWFCFTHTWSKGVLPYLFSAILSPQPA